VGAVMRMRKKINKQFKMSGKTCPLCGGTERYRTARSRSWRPAVFVRSYSCLTCNSQYIVLFGRFSLLTEKGFTPFYIPSSDGESAIHSE
jgi:hypothetical protein